MPAAACEVDLPAGAAGPMLDAVAARTQGVAGRHGGRGGRTAAAAIPNRARVMVDDPDVAARVALWTSVPDELTAAGDVGGPA